MGASLLRPIKSQLFMRKGNAHYKVRSTENYIRKNRLLCINPLKSNYNQFVTSLSGRHFRNARIEFGEVRAEVGLRLGLGVEVGVDVGGRGQGPQAGAGAGAAARGQGRDLKIGEK